MKSRFVWATAFVLGASLTLVFGGVRVAAAASVKCGIHTCTSANATPLCVNGQCVLGPCNAGFENCDGNALNGCETSLNTSKSNCGACGVVCPSAEACLSGSCQCPHGGSLCGRHCVDEHSDNNNCGACGNQCPAGETCVDSECTSPCPAGQITCGGTCVDPSMDPANCGSCGVTCSTGEACENGVCTMNPAPQCSGQTCSTFTTCNPNSCSGGGVCGSTAEGGGLCVDGTTQCNTLTGCTTSADCAAGEICIVQSCCGTGVCLPPTRFCP